MPPAAPSLVQVSRKATPKTPTEWLRAPLIVGFVATLPVVALWEHGPRAFWTGFLPFLPIGIVLMGFHRWRRVCPLAAFSALGQMVPRKKQRRVGAFFERWSYLVSFGVLAVCLALRLLLVNGNGVALALLLAGFAFAAFVAGVVFTGKSWCNFFCPLGVVEKIYTEPIGLRETDNSQCAKCTACKKHCPDIDAESHYWKELDLGSRRTAYYAFPGLIWGFYTAFALPRGSFDDYFSGAWTRVPPGTSLWLEPGLFFSATLPRVLTVPGHLALCVLLSIALFRAVESVVARRIEAASARHATLTLASFTAFVSFYAFAGQPTYRLAPGLSLLMPLTAAVVAALSLARRYGRREEDHVMARTVKKLLAKWPYPDPPPRDPREVVFVVKNREKEQGRVLALYEDAMREVLADGVISKSERRILDRMREDFGITRADHDALERRLRSELRATAEGGASPSVERRLQLDGYRAALHALLVARAPDDEIERLRQSYGVSTSAHATVLAELRADGSPLHLSIKEAVDEIARLRAVLGDLGGLLKFRANQLLYVVLLRRQAASVARALSYAALLRPDAQGLMHAVQSRVSSPDRAAREEGLSMLQGVLPDLAASLRAAVIERRPPAPSASEAGALTKAFERMMDGSDPFVKAASLIAAALGQPSIVGARLEAASTHAHPLVREAAALASGLVAPGQRPLIERLADDLVPHVRSTAQALLDAPDTASQRLSAEETSRFASTSPGTMPESSGDFVSLPTPERMLVLGQIPLFAELEVEHLFDIAVLATERRFAEGAAMCHEGDRGEEVFVVVAGEAEVLRGGAAVGVVKAGDCVGELAVLDDAPRAATLITKRPVAALVIEGGAFRELTRRDPELSSALLSLMVRRLRGMLDRGAPRPPSPAA